MRDWVFTQSLLLRDLGVLVLQEELGMCDFVCSGCGITHRYAREVRNISLDNSLTAGTNPHVSAAK